MLLLGMKRTGVKRGVLSSFDAVYTDYKAWMIDQRQLKTVVARPLALKAWENLEHCSLVVRREGHRASRQGARAGAYENQFGPRDLGVSDAALREAMRGFSNPTTILTAFFQTVFSAGG